MRKSVGFLCVFLTPRRKPVSPERCRKKWARAFRTGFVRKNWRRNVRFSSGGAHAFKTAGVFSMFLPLFLHAPEFMRFHSGGVAKINFLCFPCGFAVLENVHFSLVGAIDFAILSISSMIFVRFWKYWKTNAFRILECVFFLSLSAFAVFPVPGAILCSRDRFRRGSRVVWASREQFPFYTRISTAPAL